MQAKNWITRFGLVGDDRQNELKLTQAGMHRIGARQLAIVIRQHSLPLLVIDMAMARTYCSSLASSLHFRCGQGWGHKPGVTMESLPTFQSS
jgi:hypothetical protein